MTHFGARHSLSLFADYGLCDTDATNTVHLGGTYGLPIGHGRALLGNSNGVVDAVIGGWGTYFIYSFQGGQPFTVGGPSSTSNFGCNAFLVPGQNLYAGPHNKTQWLNPAAFSLPPMASAIGQPDYLPLGGGPQQAVVRTSITWMLHYSRTSTFTKAPHLSFVWKHSMRQIRRSSDSPTT
jgi:hypothetical protein